MTRIPLVRIKQAATNFPPIAHRASGTGSGCRPSGAMTSKNAFSA